MRVLMLGWEFPPYISGGLGTACHGLTRALAEAGVEILFVLPRPPDAPEIPRVRFLGPRRRNRRIAAAARSTPAAAARVEFRAVESPLRPYAESIEETRAVPLVAPASAVGPIGVAGGTPAAAAPPAKPVPKPRPGAALYAGDLTAAADRYAEAVEDVVAGESFDVIHAHDWMTFAAGRRVAVRTGRPLVVQFHSTEFDRCGMDARGPVCEAERAGAACADRVAAVSGCTAGIVIDRYGVPAAATTVLPNAVLFEPRAPRPRSAELRRRGPMRVLFLGRITRQKGPGYFLWAARKLLDRLPAARFVMAGDGDMAGAMQKLAFELAIDDRVAFPGFLTGTAVAQAYRTADLFVMPSVSEPFGIAALEAMLHGVPTIVSRQSGVCEFAENLLTADFWDTGGIAELAAGLLTDAKAYRRRSLAGVKEARTFVWSRTAKRCMAMYRQVVSR